MIDENFKLIIEPLIPQKQVCFYGGLEGMIGINVNGIEVLANEDGNTQKEAIGFAIDWLLKNFQNYVYERMPRYMKPAVNLYLKLDESSGEYWSISKDRKSRFFPKPGKEKFAHWLYSHNFDYSYLELPIVFQRRNRLIEVSWELNNIYYKNSKGCEYVPLKVFKKRILNTIEEALKKIKVSKKVFDYQQHEPELLGMLRQAKTI